MRKAVLGAVPFLCAALWAFGLIGHHPYNGALIGNLGWSVVGVIGDGATFGLGQPSDWGGLRYNGTPPTPPVAFCGGWGR